MPRYFFNVFDDREYIKDYKGVDLTSADEAKSEVSRLIGLLPEKLKRSGVRVCVLDERGDMLHEEWVVPPQVPVPDRRQ